MISGGWRDLAAGKEGGEGCQGSLGPSLRLSLLSPNQMAGSSRCFRQWAVGTRWQGLQLIHLVPQHSTRHMRRHCRECLLNHKMKQSTEHWESPSRAARVGVGVGVEGSAIKNTKPYFLDFIIYKCMSKGLPLAEPSA